MVVIELEKRKMNMKKIMSLAAILMIILSSCGNGKSKDDRLRDINEVIDAQIYADSEPERVKEKTKEQELIKTFRDAENARCPAYEFIKIKVIKESLIEQYGENCYDKLIEFTQEELPMEYFVVTKDDDYISGGYNKSRDDSYAKIYYDENWHGLFLTLVIDKNHIDKDGNYDNGSWKMSYYKNDFNEYNHEKPYIVLENNRTGNSSLDICIDNYCVSLYSRNSETVSGYLSSINKVIVRNEDTGEIHNVPFENGNKNLINWVIIRDQDAMLEFVRLLKNNKITISIIDSDGTKCVVRIDHERSKYVEGAILRHILKSKVY